MPIESNKTESGLEIPIEAQNETLCGKVLACGESAWFEGNLTTCPVKDGDVVLYRKYSDQTFTVRGIEYKIIRFIDVEGILNAS